MPRNPRISAIVRGRPASSAASNEQAGRAHLVAVSPSSDRAQILADRRQPTKNAKTFPARPVCQGAAQPIDGQVEHRRRISSP